MRLPKVTVLFEGYSEQPDEITMEANCSCTLIEGDKCIIVDTMTAWDGDKIIRALAEKDLSPEDMDYVVCSHGHPDHIGNNNLFLSAEHIVGRTHQLKDIFSEVDFKNGFFKLCNGVKVVSTPGHTAEDVSVLVETTLNDKNVTIAITGDLFEKFEDLENPKIWQELGDPRLRDLQEQSRAKILQVADYIIPGHGPMFAVPEKSKKLAQNWQPST